MINAILAHREKWVFALIIGIAIYFGYTKRSFMHNHESTPVVTLENSELNKKIESFIMSNPEVIIKSLEQMQLRKANQEKEKVLNLLAGRKAELENITFAPFMGNKDSKNVIVAIYDYNCEYCKKFNMILNQLVEKNPDIRIMLKQLPVLDESSLYLAKMALSVYYSYPEKFLAFHNKVFSNEDVVTKDLMKKITTDLGMDYMIVEDKMESAGVKEELSRVRGVASEAKVNGVPVLIINNEVYPGVMQLDRIEEVLKKSSAETIQEVAQEPIKEEVQDNQE